MANEIELRQLRYFAAVAELLSFGKAAKVLHVSQPPLSRQIRSLEKSLGVTLLRRSHEGVSLTAAGAVFLSEAQEILRRAERAGILARQAECGEIGMLRLGCSLYLDAALKQFLSGSVTSELDGLRLSYNLFPSADQVLLLRRQSLDAGIVRLPLPDTDQLTVELLCREPVLAMVASGHPLFGSRKVFLSALQRHDVVVFRRYALQLLHNPIYRICMQAGLHAKVVDQPECLDNLVDAVKGNDSVALVPSAIKYAWSNPKGVRFIPICEPFASLNVGVMYRRQDPSPALDRFLATMRQFPPDFGLRAEQPSLTCSRHTNRSNGDE
jgi:DNA-binding transcriptional LysR family regulator